jgi:hypothetical protein
MNQLVIIFLILGSVYFGLAALCVLAFLFFAFKGLRSLSKASEDIRQTTKAIKDKLTGTPDFLVSLVTLIGVVVSTLSKESQEKETSKEKEDEEETSEE